MNDPRQTASRLLGAIDWQTEVSGYCRCPGESLHTHTTRKQDCRVNVDGAPTIYCFHASCIPAVAAANQLLRRELSACTWALRLPDGRVIRNGDVMQATGTILPREVIKQRAVLARVSESDQLDREAFTAAVETFKPDLFSSFHWPYAQIVADSPRAVADRDAEDQFRTWLRLWPAHSTVWIGDIWSSGKPEHRAHFRPISEWSRIGPAMGNYTCGSSFKPGVHQRSNENLNGHRFLVLESDTLSRDEVGAIFSYVGRRLKLTLRAIVDTAGKSLHGWFDAPRTPEMQAHLKVGLPILGCDPKVFTFSQPVRLPGAFRDGRLQRLIWLQQ